MAMLGGYKKSPEEWLVTHERRERRARLVAETLEAEAAKHEDRNSEGYLAHAIAAQWHRSQEQKHQNDAAEMQLAIDCMAAGFRPEILSTFEIQQAKRRWDDAKAKVA